MAHISYHSDQRSPGSTDHSKTRKHLKTCSQTSRYDLWDSANGGNGLLQVSGLQLTTTSFYSLKPTPDLFSKARITRTDEYIVVAATSSACVTFPNRLLPSNLPCNDEESELLHDDAVVVVSPMDPFVH